jgi:hypothetical protein
MFVVDFEFEIPQRAYSTLHVQPLSSAVVAPVLSENRNK